MSLDIELQAINQLNEIDIKENLSDDQMTLNLSEHPSFTLNTSFTFAPKFNEIRILKLKRNKLTTSMLSPSLFQHLTNLVRLDLSWNDLLSLPGPLLKNLGNLKTLNVCISQSSLRSESCKLECNGLRCLSTEVFATLSKLQHLSLWDNKLSSLPEDVFSGLKQLTELDLRQNELIKIPIVLNDLQNLRKLWIDEPLCDRYKHNSSDQWRDCSKQICKNEYYSNLIKCSKPNLQAMPLYKESKEKQTTLLELNMQRQYEQKLTTQKHEFEAQLELQRKQIAELTKTVRDLEESQREQKEQFAQQRIKLEAELKNKDNLIEALTNNGKSISRQHSFANSCFRAKYGQSVPPKYLDKVHRSLRKFIFQYAELKGIQQTSAEAFLKELQTEALQHTNESISEAIWSCMRLWTSAKMLNRREFCSILNECIREDHPQLIELAMPLVRGLNELCISHRGLKSVAWPTDNLLYRGAGLPSSHQTHFTINKKYRCPMFLATSKNRDIGLEFCRRIPTDQHPVIYIVHLDPTHKPYHVNWVERTQVVGEDEFLFVPYSVFTVLSVDWKPNPTWKGPHEVHILASDDNALEPEDLPLITWH